MRAACSLKMTCSDTLKGHCLDSTVTKSTAKYVETNCVPLSHLKKIYSSAVALRMKLPACNPAQQKKLAFAISPTKIDHCSLTGTFFFNGFLHGNRACKLFLHGNLRITSMQFFIFLHKVLMPFSALNWLHKLRLARGYA